MKLTCVIVDDCSIQRTIVRKMVYECQDLELLASFSNAIDTKQFLSYTSVDLLLLDIEMPILNGFEFLDTLKTKPQVIFISSKTQYALKAFEYEATDYIQKPIQTKRFDVAIKKAIHKQLSKTEVQAENTDFIFIKSNLIKLKIFISKIKYFEAYGDYVKVITEDENHLVLSTMKSFENDLPKDKFIRVHKSFIVHINKIDKFNTKFIEIGNVKIPLSRTKKEVLKNAFESVQ